ncbi:MAG: Na+/H+ antiporter NhaA, partial [bacterium]|nr:Na+/H+ antiporter NhaA [bacterium]
MSSESKLVERYWGTNGSWLVNIDRNMPSIFVALLVSVPLRYLIENIWHVHLHGNEWVELLEHGADSMLWFFFAHLGTHVSISKLQRSGYMLGSMTLAGVVGPTLLTAAIFTMAKLGGYVDVSWLAIVALSIPAMATDVAFSVGTQKISRTGGTPTERNTQGSMLEGLGIGDDVAGLLIMTLVYTTFESYTLLFLWGGLTILSYMIGERGTYTNRVQLVASLDEGGNYTKIKGQPVQYFMHIIRADSVLLWWAIMALSTIAIVGMGVNPVLGGCLLIIFAPDCVKEQISAMVEPITVVVLF